MTKLFGDYLGDIVRKLIASLFIALDGVVEAPDQWHFPYFNDEMGVAVTASLTSADTILFGRKGMRLFDEGDQPIPLKLLSSQTFKTGVLNLVYAPAESPGDAGYDEAKVHLPQD